MSTLIKCFDSYILSYIQLHAFSINTFTSNTRLKLAMHVTIQK